MVSVSVDPKIRWCNHSRPIHPVQIIIRNHQRPPMSSSQTVGEAIYNAQSKKKKIKKKRGTYTDCFTQVFVHQNNCSKLIRFLCFCIVEEVLFFFFFLGKRWETRKYNKLASFTIQYAFSITFFGILKEICVTLLPQQLACVDVFVNLFLTIICLKVLVGRTLKCIHQKKKKKQEIKCGTI